MNGSILFENEKKRLNEPLWMLICFSMFCFWQMGFIYFMGPALSLNGRTPLPINMDNVTSVIIISYVLSILWMIFIPHLVVKTQRISTLIGLLTVFGLFLPLSDDILMLLIYIHVFSCCLMIGFETFIMVNYFNETSTITHLTLAYGIAVLLIALVQNDFVPISFNVFLITTVFALILLLIFFFKLPSDKASLPRYITKHDQITAPKRLLYGTYTLVFVGALMGVSGPAISGEVTHGVFISYFVDALVSICLYCLYKTKNIHPFKCTSICMGLSALGFLLMYVASAVPSLAYVSCVLIGLGMVTCQMLPLYGSALMKTYPSKSISPTIIFLSMIAVLVQSSMVELFRSMPVMLNLIYAIIMVSLTFFYLQIEPVFMYSLHKEIKEESKEQLVPESCTTSEHNPLDVLSKREKEVVELICLGYTNADIAKILHISLHTVKDHTKKIYPKMGVHSRFELSVLVSKIKSDQ